MKIKSDNKNYLAKIVKITDLEPHPNADRLQIATVDFQRVITGTNTKVGDIMVFFPLECTINKEFLAYSNGYRDSSLNADSEVKGLFESSGRVRAQKLRGLPSEGYLHPIAGVNEWLDNAKIDDVITEDNVGTEFDTLGDTLFVEKYLSPSHRIKGTANKTKGKKAKKVSRLVENQFYLHEDTENLKRNMLKVSPEDWISISYKLHGTSGAFGNILTKRKLSFFDKIHKFIFGYAKDENVYDLVISSRKVIKNGFEDKKSNSYYDFDIWSEVGKELSGKVEPTITLYGEIVGQLPNGKWIQKNYDYGCRNGKHEFYVYRITSVSPVGKVYEFGPLERQKYCEKYGLNHVPMFYFGKAKDLFEIDTDDHWHSTFLEKLQEKYNEKDCFMCKHKLPEEGVVLRKEGGLFEAYKCKSMRFLEMETKSLDKGEENIEDSQ